MQGLHFYHDRFEQSRWFLWIPVLMAAGSVTYFSLDKEPTYTVQLLILIISIVIRKRIRKYLLSTNIIVAAGEGSGGAISEQGYSQSNSYAGGAGECGYATSEQWVSQSNLYVGERVYFVLMWLLFATNLTIAFSLGFISGKVRTALQHTPTFEAALPFSSQGNDCTTCTGIVESIEDVPRGTLKRPRQLRRCILSHLQGVPPNVKIRVQGPYKKLKNVTLFEAVSLSVEIFKPPTPLTIHGYDAQFDAYFKGLSAFGKVHEVLTGDIVSTGGTRTAGETPSHATSVSRIHIIRTQLSDKLRAHLPASVSPIATALITGDKSGITLQTRENFTRSGLSHMLAISGLHMGLLAWLVFTIFSRLLVFVPRLATRFVVKKIAAILTIPFTFGYLVLSGSSFSAIRAFIMVTLSMLAILCNQRAISLRNTAIAACLILLIFPESAFSVSFQLSFASVTGLCFLAELANKRRQRQQSDPKYNHSFYSRSAFFRFCSSKIIFPLGQSIGTTMIATLATTPIIVYVFQRITLVGVLGNLVAVPFLSFCVMPLLAVLMIIPTKLVFALFGESLTVLSRIAEAIAALPGSNFLLPKPSLISVLMITFSAMWFIVWQGRKRLFFLPCFLAGWVMLFCPHHPDVFLTKDLIGVCDAGTFYISSQRFGSFHAKVWSQECGVSEVKPMSYADIQKWQSQLDNFIPDDENDVIFLWKKKNGGFLSKTLTFRNRARPWVDSGLG